MQKILKSLLLKNIKLLLPPVFLFFYKKMIKNIKISFKNTDKRRWWDGETVNSNSYKFKNVFNNFTDKCLAVTINKETRESIQIFANSSKTFFIKNMLKKNILFGFGNLSSAHFVSGNIEIFNGDNNILKLSNPTSHKWENFKIDFSSFAKDLVIKNNTQETIYFSAPVLLEEAHANEIQNIIIIFIDQISNEIFSEIEESTLMPFMQSFFKNSINFENYYSSSEWTVPSIYSFLNGKYSSSHGMFDFNFTKNIADPLLDENIIEFFKKKNYFSLGISRSKGHHVGFNFHKYFDRFYYFPATKKTFRDDDFEQKIIEHIEANSKGKNFIFAHYLSAHTPFYQTTINEEINLKNNRIGDPLLDFESSVLGTGSSKIEKILKKDKVKNINKRQIERLRSVDLSLSKLFNYINTKFKKKTLLMLTSDHGMNHIESKTDNYLNKNRINVPLKIFYPSINQELKIKTLFSSINIYELIKRMHIKSFNNSKKNIEKKIKNMFKKNQTISESIYENTYKISVRSESIVFDHICYFDFNKKIIYLNKLSKSRITNLLNNKINDKEVTDLYMKKIIQHLNKSKLLKLET